MNYKSLQIHIKLYEALQIDSRKSKYRTLLREELNLENLDESIFSTAEHLAPFNVRSSISFLLPQLLLQYFNIVSKKRIVVLGGSLIPLDNFDYPRGFYTTSEDKKAINLYSKKYRKQAVLLTDAPFWEEINIRQREDLFEDKKFLRLPFFEHHTNLAYFHASMMEKMIREWLFTQTKVVVKPLEVIAKNILVKLLENNDEIVSGLFEKLAFFQKQTYNVFCAWNEKRGTALFWAVDGHTLKRLDYKEGFLYTDHIAFALEREEVLKLLKENKILPGVALSLFIVSWLPNIPVNGGNRQYWYWSYMSAAFNQVFPKLAKRSELSHFGYNLLDFSKSKILSRYGTGLQLCSNMFDFKLLLKDIMQLPENHTSYKDGYYEC